MSRCVFLVLAVLLCVIWRSHGRFKVRRCCKENQRFVNLNCVDVEDSSIIFNSSSYLNVTWPWWFPDDKKIISRSSNEIMKEFPFDREVTSGKKQPCCFSESALLPNFYYEYDFFDDGSIRVNDTEIQNKNLTYPPLSYCVDKSKDASGNDSAEYAVLLCPCDTTVCVRKCCAMGMALNIPAREEKTISENNCLQNFGESWKPQGMESYFILHGLFPDCKVGEEEVVITNVTSSDAFQIFNNGSAVLNGNSLDRFKFCGEYLLHERLNSRSLHVLSCRPRRDGHVQARRILYGTLSVIGALFLILTLVTYALLTREFTVNDRNLIAHTWSLLIGYLGISIAQFAQQHIPHSLCVILGFVILYAFLASFFWLNVLCIDLAWAFSELRLIRNMMVWQNRRRFLQYSLYAWISPAIIVLATIIVDFAPGIPYSVIKPEFATKCWFPNDSLAKLAYFYGPIAVILATNVLLFMYTAYKIVMAQKQASSLLQNNAANEKQRIILYLKLFCLMGLSWVFELVSWLVGGPDYYWYGTDMINLFRAVFIFFTLCCKREVLEELREKFKYPAILGRQTASPSVTTLSSQLPELRSRQSSSSF